MPPSPAILKNLLFSKGVSCFHFWTSTCVSLCWEHFGPGKIISIQILTLFKDNSSLLLCLKKPLGSAFIAISYRVSSHDMQHVSPFKDATAWFMHQPLLDSKAVNVFKRWLCSNRVLDRYEGFQKTPHFSPPGDSMLTLLMMYEQESTDLGLSPDSDKYDLDKPRQFNFSGPPFLPWGCTLYMRVLERGSWALSQVSS